jgi:putative transposase
MVCTHTRCARGCVRSGCRVRKQEPSRAWKRTQAGLRKAHARAANLRLDRMHKLTTKLAQAHTVIGVETLAVKNMMASGGVRKRGLNRAMANASLGRLLRQIDYKAGWYGAQVVKAGRWHPSSKICSGCGAVKAKLALAERTYVCTDCGLVIDRDHNAAINLARYALAATDPSAGFDTGGADRKTTASAALVAVKPEPEPEQDTPATVGAPRRKARRPDMRTPSRSHAFQATAGSDHDRYQRHAPRAGRDAW